MAHQTPDIRTDFISIRSNVTRNMGMSGCPHMHIKKKQKTMSCMKPEFKVVTQFISKMIEQLTLLLSHFLQTETHTF